MPSRSGLLIAGFLGVALVLGGGGTPSPAAEILVQLAFAGAVLAWIWWVGDSNGGDRRPPRLIVVLAAMAVAVPVIQLIPLPPAIWQGLPGRQLEVDTLGLIGAADGWRPMTISPYRTLASLLATVPAVGLMLAVAAANLQERKVVLATIVLVTFAGAMLGALQLVSGSEGAFQLYEKSHHGWLTGFFANRNAAVDALLIGSMALTCGFVLRARERTASASAIALFLMLQLAMLVAAVLTGSRAGIALIPIALLYQFAMLRRSRVDRRLAKGALVSAVMAGAVFIGALAISGAGRIGAVAQRFDASGDVRFGIWQDSIAALSSYWPVGSGVGTFTLAFQPYERLENLDPLFTNRAHNDYLEFLIEAGLLAPVVLFAAALILARLARNAIRAGGEVRQQALFALGTLAVIGLHSIVDYPLRTMALASLAGVAIGLLAVPHNYSQEDGRSGKTA